MRQKWGYPMSKASQMIIPKEKKIILATAGGKPWVFGPFPF
jgi:hypothetical protein